MTVVQILYSGLGGHSSVGFSLIEADVHKQYNHVAIFYGIEAMPESSKAKCRELHIRYFFVEKRQGPDLKSHKKVVEILREVRPDIILLHSVNLIIPVYLYQLNQRTRLIAVEHQPNHLKIKKEWVWSVLSMFMAKKVVYLTKAYYEEMKQRLGPGFIKRKTAVINNGINTNLFKPPVSKKLKEGGAVKIGMLARLTSTKDHATLIKSFKYIIEKNRTRKFELYIAGDGETKKSLLELTSKLEIENAVYFLGLISETESVSFLNGLNIYVHASLGETMSTSIMQAMACGKPIIASAVSGITNMIRDGKTGILVPALDELALARKLQALTEDEELQKCLGENALMHAKLHFTNMAMFNKYTSLFYE